MPINYLGNGPYCYANALSMIFGDAGPGPAALEILSGSAFGMTLRGEDLPYFSPAEWVPETGIPVILDLLGWTCDKQASTPEAAIAELREASRTNPVLAGPVEMGLLPHHPNMGVAIGADHFLVVFGVEGDLVRAHDPQGFPFATIPVDALLTAWNTESLVYDVPSYQIRKNFRQVREVPLETALRASLPAAVKWLEGNSSRLAAERLAEVVEAGPNHIQHKYLTEFSVSCGARRLADAAVLLHDLGAIAAAKVLDEQANLVGALQHPLTVGENATAAALLRRLAPTYERLRDELLQETEG
ncbi:hypothetical protein [Amycolatopsis sp. H20-H5]|uniref:hypothetical protein n=1 Tax=Amycolatopsis sp. H20-H5 TaxID=3046309 RepID=UPI002DB6B4FB|nr:hypothetical protein [Amycolatopsis sp. H20-H5]MEC3976895.1 hypothetical protein [Amycolatopsis sp. H20-H5]